MTKRLLVNGLKYGLGIALLIYVIWRNWDPPPGGVGLAAALQRPIQFWALGLAAIIYLVGVVFTFNRWYVLVKAQELPFTPVNALRLGLIGFFLSTFLPGSIGGDIIKAAFLAREQSRRTVAVATVLVDRAMGLWGLIWVVFLLGAGFWIAGNPILMNDPKLRTIVTTATTIIAITLGLWGVLLILPQRRADIFAGRLTRIPKVGHSLAEFWRAIWMYRMKRFDLLLALLISIVSHLCFVFAFYFAAQVFQAPGEKPEIPTLTEHFLLVPIGTAIQALFPAPGGVGGSEYGFGKLYALVGCPEANGVLASLAQRVIVWGLSLIGYVVYLRMRPALRQVREVEFQETMTGQIQPGPT